MVNFAMEVVIQRANIPVGKSFDLVSAAGNYRRATLETQKWCSPVQQRFPSFIPLSPQNASSSPFHSRLSLSFQLPDRVQFLERIKSRNYKIKILGLLRLITFQYLHTYFENLYSLVSL